VHAHRPVGHQLIPFFDVETLTDLIDWTTPPDVHYLDQ